MLIVSICAECLLLPHLFFFFFFFNDTATTEIYTLSLHDALPILLLPLMDRIPTGERRAGDLQFCFIRRGLLLAGRDRKSTRLNSSHSQISYAVFCLKKKKQNTEHVTQLSAYMLDHCASSTCDTAA